MNTLTTINILVAGIIGVVTGIVSWRVLRDALNIRNPLGGICVGALTGLGLATHTGGSMSGLLIPYEALGVAIVMMLLLMPFLKGKKNKGEKYPQTKPATRACPEPEDPWEKELRLRRKRSNK